MGKLSPLLVSLLAADVKSAVKRARILAIFYAIAGLFAVSAFAALLVAAGIALSHSIRPELAALLLAAILVSISLMILAAASIWSACQRRLAKTGTAAKTMAAAAAVTFLPMLASNRAGLGLVAAFAGYALARRKSSTHPH